MDQWVTLELICACAGGLIGALVAILNNNKSETFVEGTLNVLIGIIFAAAAGTKFGDNTPTMACFIGVIGGVAGSRVIEAISRLAPDAAWSLVAGWVEKLGGKPLDKWKERKKDAENDNQPSRD